MLSSKNLCKVTPSGAGLVSRRDGLRVRVDWTAGSAPGNEVVERLIRIVVNGLRRSSPPATPFRSTRTTACYRLVDREPTPPIFLKVYWYKDVRAVLRGCLRNTWLGRSRAKAEWIALRRMRDAGVATPAPVALIESRRGRGLRACAIATAWIDDAVPLDRAWVDADAFGRRRLLDACAATVARLHAAGLADGDLHPRNILVTWADGDPTTWCIDAPKGHRSRRRADHSHDLACIDVGLRALTTATTRRRAWLRYARARGIPRRAWPAWFAAIDRRHDRIAQRESRRLLEDAPEPPRCEP